jgi:hypothetical protein
MYTNFEALNQTKTTQKILFTRTGPTDCFISADNVDKQIPFRNVYRPEMKKYLSLTP